MKAFITFEGTEGGGKSTQVHLFAEQLRKHNIGHIVTREPGGTAISEKIRNILLNPEHQEMANQTEALLYAAARAQHVQQVIKPTLAMRKLVVCDRFFDASLAYQGYGLGLDLAGVRAVNNFAMLGVEPDLTFLLDLPISIGMQRISSERGINQDLAIQGLDRIEQKDLVYHERVRAGFLEIAKNNKQRVVVVDAARTVSEIAEHIWETFTVRYLS